MKSTLFRYRAFPVGFAVTYLLILFMEYIGLIRIPPDSWISNFLGFFFYAFFISLAMHKYLQKGGTLLRVGAGLLILVIVIFTTGYYTGHLRDNPLVILLLVFFWLMLFYFILPDFFRKYSILILILYCGSAIFFLYARLFTGSFEIYESEYKMWALTLFVLPVPILVILWIYEQWKWFRTLKAEKSKAELALLRSQVNPHFFFNTLNNLYSLVVQKSDKAPDVILKLSDMMRYTIYEGDKESVRLEDEIGYLQQYIDLHKIRYNKKVDVRFNAPDAADTFVAPLLFIVLLENAFKHGVETMREGAYIHITLENEGGNVRFEIRNNFNEFTVEETSGIGLENLKKRLRLLYPGRHSLDIVKENNNFTVTLELNTL
ncbi:hypothetical protein DDZ15_10895 [Rhodohalobacter mucosus]|uniref:Signal transduction histidine kinase internal region domain-containing protein n=2 Tax=Rhodohalobacter mucosus TaxID=2079485 RepID=A0A316TPI8_9BACT|nr:hypothetical protein DDZ15_10895 [Rhodohalobacter mucosus]